jgi:hypothetical protein
LLKRQLQKKKLTGEKRTKKVGVDGKKGTCKKFAAIVFVCMDMMPFDSSRSVQNANNASLSI